MVLAAALWLLSQAVSPVKLDLQIRPFVELYFQTRVRLSAGSNSGVDPRAAALALSAVDAADLGCDSPEAFLAACEKLPKSIQRSGQTLEIRATAMNLAQAILQMTPSDRDTAANARRTLLEAKRNEVEAAFARYPALLPSAAESLSLEPKPLSVPVVLVTEMPPPGAATYRVTFDQAVCAIGVKGLSGSDLIETVLHEVVHAMDAANPRGPSSLVDLRAALTTAAADPKIAAECVHAVIFAQAAATVMKVVDPKHVPVGERKDGPYGRMGKAAHETVAIWTDKCAGRLDAKAAVEKIVAAAKAGSQTPPARF